jgi:uncharacterized cupin superfamily protein
MATTKLAYQSSTVAETYEPFMVDGKQIGEVHWLRDTAGGDGVLLTGLWRAEPGSFDYAFETDETFLLLEGAVSIDLEDGETVELKKGDLVSFVAGSKATWHVRSASKKFFVCSG